MKTIIVGIDFGFNDYTALDMVDVLQSKMFKDKNDLIKFLKEEYNFDVIADGYLFDSVQGFCNDLNSGLLDSECNAFAACTIKN